MVRIALIAMIVAILAQHLGLSEAVARIILKIAKCPKCLTFWCVLGAEIAMHSNPLIAIGLSLMCAYLVSWVGLLLEYLYKLYNELWQRLNDSK